MRFLTVLSSMIAPVVVLLVIWFPDFNHYWVMSTAVSDESIHKMRSQPSDQLLEELTSYDFATPYKTKAETIVVRAREILAGILKLPGQQSLVIELPYSGDELYRMPGSVQLNLASLEIPDILLRAYEMTNEERYFVAAQETIIAWAQYERQALMPAGMMWNDHAISARVAVLSRFWRLYRGHAGFKDDVAREILEAAARIGEFLMKPDHFTARSNHGVMQNLGLIQLALSFPYLPDASVYKTVGIKRAEQQMTYYVNDEGVILEHSAGYHKLGLQLLAVFARFMSLMDLDLSLKWIEKYRKALVFYNLLRRPDGTLPKFGDTTSGVQDNLHVASIVDDGAIANLRYSEFESPPSGANLFPVAGYAVWWDENSTPASARTKRSQTVVSWSRFSMNAHKHADDMSIFLWSAGRSWITATGYWPYDSPYRNTAISWSGSNAPHILGEKETGPITTEIRGHAYTSDLAVLDLIRNSENDCEIGRQLIRMAQATWFVIDSFVNCENYEKSIVWTVNEGLEQVEELGTNAFRLGDNSREEELDLVFLFDAQSTIRWYRGENNPFRGWTMVDGQPTAVPAVEVRSVGSRWIITAISVGIQAEQISLESMAMVNWENPENWELGVNKNENALSLIRQGDRVSVVPPGHNTAASEVRMTHPVSYKSKKDIIEQSYEKVLAAYPVYQSFRLYRLRASYLVGALLAFQEVFILIVGFLIPKRKMDFRNTSVVCWIAVGVWISGWYLV